MRKSKGKSKMDEGLQRAVKAVGTRYALAKALKVNPSTILKWHTIPPRRILEVERVTGVDRTILRPDLYRRGRD